MGVESFFIECKVFDSHIEIHEGIKQYVGSKIKIVDDFLLFLQLCGYKIKSQKKYYKRYIIDGKLFLDIFSDNNYLQGFSLEGCFSNYNKTLNIAKKIIILTNSRFLQLKLKTSNTGVYNSINQGSLDDLVKSIDYRYNVFNEKYHCSFNSLPGDMFFRKYRFYKFFNKRI